MEIDLRSLEHRHAHDLLTSCIIPRPIAWVSTINQDGKQNLAPFSFFTGVSWAPPIVAFSVVNRADGTKKDTLINILEIPEFVINIVSVDLLKPMEDSAKPIPYGEDADYLNNIHLLPCRKIRPYRVQESRVSLECTLEKVVSISEGANAGNLILGQVQLLHVQDDLVENGREIDWFGLDVLGRLSGNRYCAVRTAIESEMN